MTPSWDYTNPDDLIEAAWGIIANAQGGDWDAATPKWKQAAERWRDGYHDNVANQPQLFSEEDQIDMAPNVTKLRPDTP